MNYFNIGSDQVPKPENLEAFFKLRMQNTAIDIHLKYRSHQRNPLHAEITEKHELLITCRFCRVVFLEKSDMS